MLRLVMIASELALELGIEAATLSKRLKLYLGETGEERSKVLSELTTQHMQEVDRLIRSNQAANTRTAVHMVLGKYVEAAPPSSVKKIENLLTQLMEGQHALHLKLDRVLTAKSEQTSTPVALSPLSMGSTVEMDQIFASIEVNR